MLELKLHTKILLKETLASVANISGAAKASLSYTQDELSLRVYKVPAAGNCMLIAVLHLLPSHFKMFYCDKPGHIYIDLNAFSELLNLATDNESITISFGDIRKVKTYRGDKAIKFRFQDLGTGLTQHYQMEFTKAVKEPVDKCEWQYNDLAIGIPAKEFNRVFTELDIAGETGAADDSLSISISNEKLKFTARDKEIVLAKELGEYEVRGDDIEQPINQVCSLEFASSYLNAVKMTDDKVWLLRSNVLGTLLKCQIGHLGDVIFNLHPFTEIDN